MRFRLIALLACLVLLTATTRATAGDLFLELAHASNARITDRDLGRNFVHLGWQFPRGFSVSGGTYHPGESHCFWSLTLGQSLLQHRWQVAVTAHNGGICSIDGSLVPFDSNFGVCMNRQLIDRPRWTVGIGGCLWQRADYAVGDITNPNNPLSLKDANGQPTGSFVIRFRPGKR
ncbi:MAG: hypothetical protein OEY27_06940 [Gammaproteobacteria bacterium]|nr:hypothetical protein [Gammaproteobacteria bacterium]